MAIKILWPGDSTAEGFVPPIGSCSEYFTENTEASVATRLLNERFGQGSVVSENIAVGGTNIKQWLNGYIDTAKNIDIPPWSSLMASTDATIIVMTVGINNAYTPGITSAIFNSDVMTMRNCALAHGKTLIWCTSNPIDK